jgi:NADH:ubiquinone oxidoreductase subunit 6 (subunit J)
MELSFIFYLFTAFIVIPGTYFLLSTQRMYIAGIIASIGLLILFILFGIQLFTVEGNYVTSPSKMTWPPSINTCPDFLSLYKINGTYSCVDTAGVSTNGGLPKFEPVNGTGTSQTPTAAQLFNLFLSDSDANRKNSIKTECINKGVTWEGVYDGINGYNNTIPKPT